MRRSSSKPKKQPTRDAIIGLGEDSVRKSYYPELQEKLLALERTNIRNQALIHTIPDILLVSDLSGHISPLTTTAEVHFPIIGNILTNPEILRLLRENIQKSIKTGTLNSCLFSMLFKEKNFYYEARISLDALDEVLIIIRDITEQTLLEKRLREAAERDSLTGLYNRRSFEAQLNSFDQTFCQSFSILLLDIDGLKLINDTLGHLSGDQLIRSMADIIDTIFSPLGFVGRIGGDEFGVIMEGVTPANIEYYLLNLNKMVETYNQTHDTIQITLSYGYATVESDEIRTLYLYQEADNNMYQNKLLKTRSTKHDTVKTLMKALEVRDYITEGHADRMGTHAVKIGRHLGLGQSIIDRIMLLTKFHDIGKVGIPDAILNKPGKLDDAEYRIMKTHSAIGERIANESRELKDIAGLILLHHEKWDGTGYPQGLADENIPIECRILSLVDTYDAMTNDRPYRKALPHEEAVEELIRCSGSQFDPRLVEVYLEILE